MAVRHYFDTGPFLNVANLKQSSRDAGFSVENISQDSLLLVHRAIFSETAILTCMAHAYILSVRYGIGYCGLEADIQSFLDCS